MKRQKWSFHIADDLGRGLHGIGTSLGLLFGLGVLAENVGSHSIVVGGEMFELLSEGADACKFALGGLERIFILGHGFGDGDNFMFCGRDPEVERFTDTERGLCQRHVAVEGEKQAGENASVNFHDSSLKTSPGTLTTNGSASI